MCESKAVPVLKHKAVKTYGEINAWLRTVLTEALDGGEWSVSGSGYFSLGLLDPLDGKLRP
jgi:hypothetical protein